MWALGGEFIRDLHSDPSLRKKPVGRVLLQMIEYGGPLLYHGGEDQQRSVAQFYAQHNMRYSELPDLLEKALKKAPEVQPGAVSDLTSRVARRPCLAISGRGLRPEFGLTPVTTGQ
jgi:hypothetical protein